MPIYSTIDFFSLNIQASHNTLLDRLARIHRFQPFAAIISQKKVCACNSKETLFSHVFEDLICSHYDLTWSKLPTLPPVWVVTMVRIIHILSSYLFVPSSYCSSSAHMVTPMLAINELSAVFCIFSLEQCCYLVMYTQYTIPSEYQSVFLARRVVPCWIQYIILFT